MDRLSDFNPYFAQTGNPPEVIKAYKLDVEWVGFKLERVRLDFGREKDAITRLVVKTPDITLDCPKK